MNQNSLMPASLERLQDPEDALMNFDKVTKSLNLTYEIQSLSEHTSYCLLKKDGITIERGNGKGFGVQSILSAKYESLEHYFLTQYSKSYLSSSLKYSSYHDLKESSYRIVLSEFLSKKLEDFALHDVMPWVQLEHLLDKQVGLTPLAMINPLANHNKASLFKAYSSSNGSASGLNTKEACIHAISELIERDALSCFLYSTFVTKQSSAHVIKKDSIPNRLLELLKKAEKIHNDKIALLDISSNLGIPVFLATFTNQPYPIQPIGTGCSYYSSYALERAILEAIQLKDLSTPEERINDEKVLEKFRHWPAFYRCAKAPIKSILPFLPKKQFKNNNAEVLDPEDLYEKIILELKVKEIDIFCVKLYDMEDTCCVKLISPQLETFHLCQHGHFSIPGQRIKRMFVHGHSGRKSHLSL